MNEGTQVIGRAKTVLVFNGELAVVSEIVVRRMDRRTGRKRLRFAGSVKFSVSVKKHIRQIILPVIDRIADMLDLARGNFEISAVNLGAASALDIGVIVSGLSADVPIFIAMLSELLQISVSNDFVTTGHIASVEGDIRAVKGMPAKVEAARNDGSIKRFFYPDLEKDKSLKVLSPNQRNRGLDAIMSARDSLGTRAVADIGQLVRLIFTEQSIVTAALRGGFFDISMALDQFHSPVQNVVSFLTGNNQKRFWDILYYSLSEEPEEGRDILRSYAQFFIDRQIYPRGFGARLLNVIRSLAPAIRRLKISFPIMDKNLCHKLNTFAGGDDYDDTLILLNTVHGKNITDICPINIHPRIEASDSERMVFDTVVSLINEQALARKFGAIDAARACFVLESSRVGSYEDFIDIVQAYYIHLQRYIGSAPEKPDISDARSEAIKLLEKTFYNKGGDRAAFVQARDCTQSGIRHILDMLTDQYKAEKQDAYINRVLKDAIAGLDWQERVKCIRAIMKMIGPSLPEELKDQPPERFARNEETIGTMIQTYVKCRDNFNQALNRM